MWTAWAAFSTRPMPQTDTPTGQTDQTIRQSSHFPDPTRRPRIPEGIATECIMLPICRADAEVGLSGVGANASCRPPSLSA